MTGRLADQAQAVWNDVAADVPLRLDALHQDIFAMDDLQDTAEEHLGTAPWATDEVAVHRASKALARLGIAGPGRLESQRDRQRWSVPTERQWDWELICGAIHAHQTAPIRDDLLRSQVRPGWVHPDIVVGHATTGRTYIKTPRLQGLGKREIARYIDMDLLIVDQSRAEPTVLARLSGDTVLTEDLTGDPYWALADDLGIDRATAKRVFMSIPYGTGADRLAQDLDLTKDEAHAIVKGWRDRYADAAVWCDDRVAEAATGRVRLYDGTRLRVEHAYQGPAYVGQGTGALLTHEWTVAAHDALPDGAILAWPIHDALAVEICDEDVRPEAETVLLDTLGELSIPLRGDVERNEES
ncbi:DNA polymerase [Brevibacterium sp. FAM 24638]|uniref:DNA polymerase n=1 Tax=Brevibacterium sp. FAM 24638 TaxID=3415681 RepID=UPI003C7D2723